MLHDNKQFDDLLNSVSRTILVDTMSVVLDVHRQTYETSTILHQIEQVRASLRTLYNLIENEY